MCPLISKRNKQKQKSRSIETSAFLMYSRRDLNPHDRNGHWILSPTCLPIPPLELGLFIYRAKNGARTRDLNLGKVALYQLSYFRKYVYEHQYYCCIADANLIHFFKYQSVLLKKNKLFFNPLVINYFFLRCNILLISFSFIKASTGVKVSISVSKISSLISSNSGSSILKKLSCKSSSTFLRSSASSSLE